MPEPDADLALLIDAARAAGEIARRYHGADPEVMVKPDKSPVTEADLAIDTMLRHELLAARPGYGWLSEETEDDTARLGAEHVFIVDPIDGTRAFIAGETSFAHSLAIARNGEIMAAAVYLPLRDRLYTATKGHGAQLNGAALRVRDTRTLEQAEVLTTKPNLAPIHWPRGVPSFRRAYRPSLAYRMSLVGAGRFDAMVTFRDTWEWDVAAGALIVSEAGGRVSTGHGGAVSFNGPEAKIPGLCAGAPAIHQALLEAHNA